MNIMNRPAIEVIPQRKPWSNPHLQRAKTTQERFFEKIDKNGPIPQHDPKLGPCHIWSGSIKNSGYGTFNSNGKTVCAHRFGFEIFVGNIPENLDVLHKCDNRRCVRPDHLFLGTDKDNSDDKLRKGRANILKGEKCGASKLNKIQVDQIRLMYESGEHTLKSIAKVFGVTFGNIWWIVGHKTWKD